MLVVGLTGGIASGKTAVSDRFAALGVPVVDTDLIARSVVEPGHPALGKVIAAFGKDIVDEHGNLRRRKLREMIFSDPEKQELLESILHPAIRAEANCLHRVGVTIQHSVFLTFWLRHIPQPYSLVVTAASDDTTTGAEVNSFYSKGVILPDLKPLPGGHIP